MWLSEREGNIKSHINAFADMLSYEFACNHLNYARWGHCISQKCISWRKHTQMSLQNSLMGSTQQSVYSGISRHFSRVWSDMAIEQSVNRDCGTLGGMTGLKINVSAIERWFLTAHQMLQLLPKQC